MISPKRFFDIAFAGVTLCAAAPVLLALSAAIRVESSGPVLFSQIRVGRGRRPIRTLKLRTMVTGAERLGAQLTAHGDPRITRVGRFLRRTKLDELPQLWNVLRGDMSLVGPRPEVPTYVSTYRAEWEPLFSVRPGLTDLASLTFSDEERLLADAHDRERAYREVIMPMKLALALEGVERSSIKHDLTIMLRTALAIVGRRAPHDDDIRAEVRRRIDQLNRTIEGA